MYAVVLIGGKQYKVTVGDQISVDKIEGAMGSIVSFDHVYLAGNGNDVKIGSPTLRGFTVKAKILATTKGKKIDVRRFKSKVRVRKHRGFRPMITRLEITSIGPS